jgi:uncharacterized membrane protein YjgN (DUF898 family)
MVRPLGKGLNFLMSTIDTTAAPGSHRITWVHPQGGFLGLSLLNGLLRVLTLGVYHFWGKTEVRQRIWSAVRIDDEPLEYRGTGAELFKGFLIVFVVVVVPIGLIGLLPLLLGGGLGFEALLQFTIVFIIFVLGGLAIFRARRYRLSRTRWRGIRGGLTGSSLSFAWTYLWTMMLIPLTLGWIVPWRAVKLHRALFMETQFGDKGFIFTGRSGPLYARYWLVWVSGIVLYIVVAIGFAVVVFLGSDGPVTPDTPPQLSYAQIAAMVAIVLGAFFIFALIRAWYSSGMFNYFASQTLYEGCTFRLHTTVPSLMWLVATNYLIRLLSLGILSPIAEARSMHYIVERLTIEGHVDWPAIGQNPAALMARGEGLAEAFDVDAF